MASLRGSRATGMMASSVYGDGEKGKKKKGRRQKDGTVQKST
jgi:hypothetical protein